MGCGAKAGAGVGLTILLVFSYFTASLYLERNGNGSTLAGNAGGAAEVEMLNPAETDALSSFATWAEAWASGSALDSSQGATLAGRRRAVMERLIRTDPARALTEALPPSVLSSLPPDVAAGVETWIVDEARFVVAAAYPPQAPFYSLELVATGERLAAFLYGTRAKEGVPTTVIPVVGVRVGEFVAVSNLAALITTDAADLASDASLAPEADAHGPVYAQVVDTVYTFESEEAAIAFASGPAFELFFSSGEAREFTRSKVEEELRTLVMIVQFADEASPPTDVLSYERLMASVSAYWDDNSYGCTQFDVEYTPVLQLSSAKATYRGTDSCPISITLTDNSPLDNDAWLVASSSFGFNVNDYDRYIQVYSTFEGCQWEGLGLISGRASWINGKVDPLTEWHVTTHELGHNYGLQHANYWNPSGSDQFGAGSVENYYDDFAIMGTIGTEEDMSTAHVNAYRKNGLTWLPDDDVLDLADIRTSCTADACFVRIFQQDNVAATGRRAARFAMAGPETDWVWVEYKPRVSHVNARDNFLNGLVFTMIQSVGSNDFESPTGTLLVDMSEPFAGSDALDPELDDAPLQLGRSWISTLSGYALTPVALGAINTIQFMDMAVYAGSASTAPIISSGIVASCSSVKTGDTVIFSLVANDPNNLPLYYSWSFGDVTHSRFSSPRAVKTFDERGDFTVTVYVSNLHGGVSTDAMAVDVKALNSGCPECGNDCVHGTCSASQCFCDEGWTGADCSTALVLASVSPTFTSLDPATQGIELTVTTTADVFVADTVPLCHFHTVGHSEGVYVSGRQIRCPAPVGVTSQTVAEISVSPDRIRWSPFDASVALTYGGGSCSPSCVFGSCDNTRAVCVCNAGYTGPTCSTALAVTSMDPAEGPSTGRLLTKIRVPAATASVFAGEVCSLDYLVRFTPASAPVSAAEIVRGTYHSASQELHCYTPPMDATGTASVSISPNRGVDWSVPETYTFVASQQLYDGRAVTGTASATGLSYHHVFHGDPNVDWRISVEELVGVTQVFVGVDKVPSPDLCSDARYSQDMHCFTGAGSKSLAFGLDAIEAGQATTGELTGRFFIAVRASSGTSTYRLTANSPPGSVIRMTTNTTGAQTGFLASAEDEKDYYFEHTGLYASRLALSRREEGSTALASFTVTLDGADEPICTNCPENTLLQSCETAGVYNVHVTGDAGAAFTMKVDELVPPQPRFPLLEAADRDVHTLRIIWQTEVFDDTTPADEMAYELFYAPSGNVSLVDSACAIRRNNPTWHLNTTFGSNLTELTLEDLPEHSEFDFNVVVRNRWGVENDIGFVLGRTKPYDIPTYLQWLIPLCSFVAGLLVFFCVMCLKCMHRRHRVKRLEKKSWLGKAKKGFTAQSPDELSFARGEFINIFGKADANGWVTGVNEDREIGNVPFVFFDKVSKGEQKELLNKSTQRGSQIKKVESISSIAVKLDKSLTARSDSGNASTGASSTASGTSYYSYDYEPSF